MATAQNEVEKAEIEADRQPGPAHTQEMSDNGEPVGSAAAQTTGESGWTTRFTRAWRDTVGAYATEEGETRNLLGRLVDFGALSKDEASRAFLQMRERIDENRRELDRRVDETLEQTISKLPFPTPGELQKLRERVKELESRLETLERS